MHGHVILMKKVAEIEKTYCTYYNVNTFGVMRAYECIRVNKTGRLNQTEVFGKKNVRKGTLLCLHFTV